MQQGDEREGFRKDHIEKSGFLGTALPLNADTPRRLLKCDVQRWVGAIVVTRFRVYACALD